jgi:beta-N-acetylhexosaminidase
MTLAFITGLAGLRLLPEERAFLKDARPAGIILFARNCEMADQIRGLVAGCREAVGGDRLLVLIDQEGGRVQRLKPPIASRLPAAARFLESTGGDVIGAARLARLAARLAADELVALGINTSCAPVLDVPVPGAHDIIGDRAFATDAATVAALGGAVADALTAGGVLPVMKHIPGHGRARADSHLELPVVEAPRDELLATDIAPFRLLSHLPAAMTAHVVYTALDPDLPASTSRRVTQEIVRDAVGFDGLLMSDDLGMRALTGSFASRAAAVLGAGSDLALHCSGRLDEMQEVAAAVSPLSGASLARLHRAHAITEARPAPFDAPAARVALAPLLGGVA